MDFLVSAFLLANSSLHIQTAFLEQLSILFDVLQEINTKDGKCLFYRTQLYSEFSFHLWACHKILLQYFPFFEMNSHVVRCIDYPAARNSFFMSLLLSAPLAKALIVFYYKDTGYRAADLECLELLKINLASSKSICTEPAKSSKFSWYARYVREKRLPKNRILRQFWSCSDIFFHFMKALQVFCIFFQVTGLKSSAYILR